MEDPTSSAEFEPPTEQYTASRRTFLKATGMAAALPIASDAVAADPVTASESGPGRIENLSSYLEDPTVFEENRESTRSTAAVPYESVETAVESDRRFTAVQERFAESSFVRSLDGEWRFQFFRNPSDMPDAFDPAGGDWDSITVPEPWQTQGYDQRIYANWRPAWIAYDYPPIQYTPEWGDINEALNPNEGDIDVPGIGADDDRPAPSAVYNRTVSVPSAWDGRELFLHFDGVKQAYFVWVDGRYVGFQKGSMTPGEFDITDHVTPGEDHELTVQVYRWCDGEALECIDMHKYSGIYRSVYMYATPEVHLRDFHVRQELDDEYEDATLSVDAQIANYADADRGEYTVEGTLRDPEGNEVTTLSASETVGADGAALSMETTVSDPEKWTAEDPTLYTLALELTPSGESEPNEAFVEKIGFREIEADRGHPGGNIRVNGELVNIRGTNRHETDPETGRTVPVETVREDFRLLKRFNLNAVRTAHYPNDPTFLRLADEYGIYVIDEAAVETHWYEGVLSTVTEYHDQCAARFRRMVLRDRNHPSVIGWSTGNEAGTAAEHLHMAAIARGTDDEHFTTSTEPATLRDGEPVEEFTETVEGIAPDRLLYHQPNQSGWDIPFCDMLGPRYINVEDLLDMAAGNQLEDSPRFPDTRFGEGHKAVVMGEYNHAMGNSLGLVDRMWNDYIQPTVRRARDDAGDADAVLVGSPAVTATEDGAALTLREGDYLEVPDPDDIDVSGPELTVAVTFESLHPNTDRELVSKGGQFAMRAHEGQRFEMSVGGSSVTGKARGRLDEGAHTLVGVVDAGKLALYLDGERIGFSGRGPDFVESAPELARFGDGDRPGADRELTLHEIEVYDRSASHSAVVDGLEDVGDRALAYDFAELLRDKSLQGGFIWDWVDQDIDATTTVDGEDVDYQFYDNEGPAGEFCLNGMVRSDRTPQPGLWQLKQSHQPVKVAARDLTNGQVYVTNHHQFTDLSELDVSWTLSAGDEVEQSGTLDLDTPPNATEAVTIDGLDLPDPEPGVEYRLTVSVTLPEATDWAEAGHEVAVAQLNVPLDAPDPEPVTPGGMPSLSLEEREDGVTVSGDEFTYTLPNDLGTFSSMEFRGTELVEHGPLLNFWRAPIMNELQTWGPGPGQAWFELGLDDIRHAVDDVSVARVADSVVEVVVDGAAFGTASSDGDLPGPGFATTYTYRILGTGDVLVDVDASPNDALREGAGEWLPKIGLQIEASEAFDEFEWYGRGPQETYPDRKTGVPVGRYSGSVEDEQFAYLPPTDNGNKAETRWAKLGDSAADVALFASAVGRRPGGRPGQSNSESPPASERMNVSVNTYANLAEAEYQYELEDRGSVALNLDHGVTGVGGTPNPPHEEYRVQPTETSFSVVLRPVTGDADPMALHRRTFDAAIDPDDTPAE